ncbi:hypothetical protein L1887_32698 [Cichorium endivia]|nr:hypothetical protein L1887_32698 [Cichorium endivia]
MLEMNLEDTELKVRKLEPSFDLVAELEENREVKEFHQDQEVGDCKKFKNKEEPERKFSLELRPGSLKFSPSRSLNVSSSRSLNLSPTEVKLKIWIW